MVCVLYPLTQLTHTHWFGRTSRLHVRLLLYRLQLISVNQYLRLYLIFSFGSQTHSQQTKMHEFVLD